MRRHIGPSQRRTLEHSCKTRASRRLENGFRQSQQQKCFILISLRPELRKWDNQDIFFFFFGQISILEALSGGWISDQNVLPPTICPLRQYKKDIGWTVLQNVVAWFCIISVTLLNNREHHQSEVQGKK